MEQFTRSVEFRMSESDGRTLEGYAAVFDSPTVINSFEGHFVEVIERGAFARTVRNNPKPVLQFDHGTHPLIGGMPIGTIQELREDDQGLFVRAHLSDSFLTEPVRVAIADGALRGMSFKFTIPEGGVTVTRGDDNLEIHTLTDVNLHELGPVVWPAYADTSVGVRSKSLTDILTADEDARTLFAAALYGATTGSDLTGNNIIAVMQTGEEARQKISEDTGLAVRSDDEPTATTEAVRSDDESDDPTGSDPDEPTAEEDSDVRSDDEPVRSEDAKPTAHPGRKAHQKRLARIMAARADRALRQFENREIKHGTRVEPSTDGQPDEGSE